MDISAHIYYYLSMAVKKKNNKGKKKKPAKKAPARKPVPSGAGNNQHTAVNDNGLNIKEQAFADAFLNLRNSTRAYMEAYPDASSETARRGGSRLMTNVHILNYISQERKKLADIAYYDRTALFLYWASVMNESDDERDKIKVSELIGKTLGVFEGGTQASGEGQGLVFNVEGGESRKSGLDGLKARMAAAKVENKDLEREAQGEKH